ncbi:hypothetical protein ACIQUU_12425 [Streptomyces sp. NPDC101116]|uniref:hypothetical protein n=1 Tax=Streptomyces sp. NPDC101116 TaxID=3366107 RepID=UPI00381AC65C
MTTTDLEKARKAAEAAAAKLTEAEAAEAARQAEKAAARVVKEHELAAKFLEDRAELEKRVKGEKPSADELAAALEAGTLTTLVADYLARRDAVNSLRAHAQHCATLIGEDGDSISDLRYVDPVEELRRWQEDAMYALRRKRADAIAAEALAAYEVA